MSLHYRLAPELLVERFEEESLVFLADADCWVRLNRTATDVLESLRADGLDGDGLGDRDRTEAAWIEHVIQSDTTLLATQVIVQRES